MESNSFIIKFVFGNQEIISSFIYIIFSSSLLNIGTVEIAAGFLFCIQG